MKSSTKDKIKGRLQRSERQPKEETGKTTGDPELTRPGPIEKAGGNGPRKIGDVKKVLRNSERTVCANPQKKHPLRGQNPTIGKDSQEYLLE